jgi:hypothetical protein
MITPWVLLGFVHMSLGCESGMAGRSADVRWLVSRDEAAFVVESDGHHLSQASEPVAKKPVPVPEGNGTPVITDGVFSPGEWDDALSIALSEAVSLHLKSYRGVVFVGVRGKGPAAIGPSELYLAVPGGEIHRLHVSAQLYENVLSATGPDQRPRFGLTPGWYASELRRDMEEAARLQKEGKDPMEIMRATSYPTDGIEFAIRRTKFPGQRWLMRLWASAMLGDRPGMLAFPPSSAEKTTDGWLELQFEKAQ